jgi:hypothetical protein
LLSGVPFFAQEYIGSSNDLEHFSLKSIAQRKAEYKEFNPFVKSNLWKHHFEKVLMSEDLNETQVDLILYIMKLLDNGLLMVDETDSLYELKVRGVIDQLKIQINDVFGPDQIPKIFWTLGDYDHLGSEPASEVRVPDCNCYTPNDYCYRDWYCIYVGKFRCIRQSWGCGTLWIEPCDGLCL